MTQKVFFTILAICALLGPQITEAKIRVSLSPATPQPGDAVFVTLDTTQPVTTASFDGKPAYSYHYKNKTRLVFAVPFNQVPGNYVLQFTMANGHIQEEIITIKKIVFKKIVLGIPKKLDLTPQKLKEKLATNKTDLTNIFTSSSETVFFTKAFGLPLYKNRVTNFYGTVHQTGNSLINHFGVDFGSPEGKPVAVMNDGRVVKAYTDTVNGNSIIVDHGGYLFTMYLHLQKMYVEAGDKVKQGQVIGTVGQTGYATGPHLHLSVKVGNTSVDPLHFIRDFR